MRRHLSIAALFWAAISCSSEKTDESIGAEQTPNESESFGNQVSLTTNLGEIVVELDPDKAPVSVANFLKYVEQGHYDTSIFHRTIDGYLIEAGKIRRDEGSYVEGPTGEPIANESRNGLRNDRGTLAMARTARPISATSAFFINLSDNIALNYPQPDGYGYAVFGRIVSGMEIADQIGKAETGVSPLTLLHPATGKPETQDVADVPIEAITILSARRIPE